MLQSSFCFVLYLNLSRDHYVLIGESGLVGQGIVVRIGRFPVQAPLGAGLDLQNQPYKAPNDLGVEYLKRSD